MEKIYGVKEIWLKETREEINTYYTDTQIYKNQRAHVQHTNIKNIYLQRQRIRSYYIQKKPSPSPPSL